MNRRCETCGTPLTGGHHRSFFGSLLCKDCAILELKTMLLDSCVEDFEDFRLLRRRVEDALRKNPYLVIEVGAKLGAEGLIKISDLV